MEIAIPLGWWLVPTAVTFVALGWHWWVHKDEQPSRDYGRIGQAAGEALTGLFALVVSLIAWLVYAFAV